MTEYKDERVDQYLSLVHESDRALQNLIEHLKESDEPTVVSFLETIFHRYQKSFISICSEYHGSEVPFEEVSELLSYSFSDLGKL